MPSSRPGRATSPTRRTGSTANGPGSNRRIRRKTRARGVTGVDVAVLKDIGRKITRVPDGFSGSSHTSSDFWRIAPRRSTAVPASTGPSPRRWRSARCWRKAAGPPVGTGQPARHLQPAPLGPVRSGQTQAATPRSTISAPIRAITKSINSLLSEAAVLGFEYGYSLADAERTGALGGAVRRLRQRRAGHDRPVHRLRRSEMAARSGLVLLLPHGYEGQGPEHSSARLERFCSCAPRTTCKWHT